MLIHHKWSFWLQFALLMKSESLHKIILKPVDNKVLMNRYSTVWSLVRTLFFGMSVLGSTSAPACLSGKSVCTAYAGWAEASSVLLSNEEHFFLSTAGHTFVLKDAANPVSFAGLLLSPLFFKAMAFGFSNKAVFSALEQTVHFSATLNSWKSFLSENQYKIQLTGVPAVVGRRLLIEFDQQLPGWRFYPIPEKTVSDEHFVNLPSYIQTLYRFWLTLVRLRVPELSLHLSEYADSPQLVIKSRVLADVAVPFSKESGRLLEANLLERGSIKGSDSTILAGDYLEIIAQALQCVSSEICRSQLSYFPNKYYLFSETLQVDATDSLSGNYLEGVRPDADSEWLIMFQNSAGWAKSPKKALMYLADEKEAILNNQDAPWVAQIHSLQPEFTVIPFAIFTQLFASLTSMLRGLWAGEVIPPEPAVVMEKDLSKALVPLEPDSTGKGLVPTHPESLRNWLSLSSIACPFCLGVGSQWLQKHLNQPPPAKSCPQNDQNKQYSSGSSQQADSSPAKKPAAQNRLSRKRAKESDWSDRDSSDPDDGDWQPNRKKGKHLKKRRGKKRTSKSSSSSAKLIKSNEEHRLPVSVSEETDEICFIQEELITSEPELEVIEDIPALDPAIIRKRFDESLHKEMEDKGYRYINIPGDNDCYFHAIATAINIGTVIAGKRPKQSAASIRQLLVDKLKKDNRLTDLLIPQLPSGLSRGELLDSLLPSESYEPTELTKRNWGGDFLNYAMQYLLGVHIIKHAYIVRYSTDDYCHLEFHTMRKRIVELGLPKCKKLQYPAHISVEQNNHYSLWLTAEQYQDLLHIEKERLDSARLFLGTQGILLPVLSDVPKPSETDNDSTESDAKDDTIDWVTEEQQPIRVESEQRPEFDWGAILHQELSQLEEFQGSCITSDETIQQFNPLSPVWSQTTNNLVKGQQAPLIKGLNLPTLYENHKRYMKISGNYCETEQQKCQAGITKVLENNLQTIRILSDHIEHLKKDKGYTERCLIDMYQKLNAALSQFQASETDKSKLQSAMEQQVIENRELQLRVNEAEKRQLEKIKFFENSLKDSLNKRKAELASFQKALQELEEKFNHETNSKLVLSEQKSKLKQEEARLKKQVHDLEEKNSQHVTKLEDFIKLGHAERESIQHQTTERVEALEKRIQELTEECKKDKACIQALRNAMEEEATKAEKKLKDLQKELLDQRITLKKTDTILETEKKLSAAYLKQIEQMEKSSQLLAESNENQLRESRSREEEACRQYSNEHQKVSDVLNNKSELLEKVIEKNLELTQQKEQMAEDLQDKDTTMQKLRDKVSQLETLLKKANSQLLRQSRDQDKAPHLHCPAKNDVGMEVAAPPDSMTEQQNPDSTGTQPSSPISTDISYYPSESEEPSDEEVEEMAISYALQQSPPSGYSEIIPMQNYASSSGSEFHQYPRLTIESTAISRSEMPHTETGPDDVNSTAEEQIELSSNLIAVKSAIELALTSPPDKRFKVMNVSGIPFPDLIGVPEAKRQWTAETFKYVVYLIKKDHHWLTQDVLRHLNDDTVEYYEACMDYSENVTLDTLTNTVASLNRKNISVPKRSPFLEKYKEKWTSKHLRIMHWQKRSDKFQPASGTFRLMFNIIDPEFDDYPRLIRDYLVHNLNSEGNTKKNLSTTERRLDIRRTLKNLKRVDPFIPAVVKGQAFNHQTWSRSAFEDFLTLYGEDYTGFSVRRGGHPSVSLSQQLHEFKEADNRDGYNEILATVCRDGNFQYRAIMNRYTHQHSHSLEFMPVDGLDLGIKAKSARLFLYYAWAFGFSSEMLDPVKRKLLFQALGAVRNIKKHELLYKQLMILLARTYKTPEEMLSSKTLKKMPVPGGDKEWNHQVIKELMGKASKLLI